MTKEPLAPLFSARSIAFIGASKDPSKWGFLVLKHLLDGGFPGRVYPINPKEQKILNLKVYRTLKDLPETPDLAVIIVPPPAVPGAIQECLAKGTKAAIIITAGFAETGRDGARLQEEIVDLARKGGMGFVGPNCNGIMSPWHKQYIQFPGFFVPPGPIGVIAQSGNVVDALALQIRMRGFGCSACIASGNEALLHCEDYLEYLGEDPHTRVILAYLEGFKDGKRFLKVAREVNRKKPLIVLKAGKTQAGARAAASHTAAMAGEDPVFEAVCRQSGIIRVQDLDELVEVGLAFLGQPLPVGRRVGIVTAGGGWGVLAADACADLGFEVVKLPETLIRELDRILPPWWSRGNPVDLVAGTSAENIFQAVEWVLKCPKVDALLFLSIMPALRLGSFDLPNDSSEREGWNRRMIEAVIEVMTRFHELARRYQKPVLAASEYMWADHVERAEINHALGRHGLVCYHLPGQAARALQALYNYNAFLGKADEAMKAV
jgi:acyl-CoA synthetase (NDP forming)